MTAPYTASVSEPDDAPIVDPDRVVVAYRRAKAERRARIEHRRRRRIAGVRFWIVFLLLLAAVVAIAYGAWHELQHLLGE